MKKIIGSLILIVGLGIFSGCQTNPDGSIGGQAKNTSTTATSSSVFENTVALETAEQVRVSHNGWATISGTTEANLEVSVSVPGSSDGLHTEKSDEKGAFQIQYKMNDKDQRKKLSVMVKKDGQLVAKQGILLVRK